MYLKSWILRIQKPDPAIFERCIEKLGVEADACLYVGDGGSNELEAAQRLGMQVVQAVWYLKEEINQPAQRKTDFEHIEKPMDIIELIKKQCLVWLYLHLHESTVPEMTEQLNRTWSTIVQDRNHHIVIKVVDNKIVSSCVCVIIPNLTRNVRPYAIIENVVTHKDYRGKGYASECLAYAKGIAKKGNCYKMMLLTGSKKESTMEFYKSAGYNCSDKTAFVQWIE